MNSTCEVWKSRRESLPGSSDRKSELFSLCDIQDRPSVPRVEKKH